MVQEYEGGPLHPAQTWNQAGTHRPAGRQSKPRLKSLVVSEMQNDEHIPNDTTDFIISLLAIQKLNVCLKGKKGT